VPARSTPANPLRAVRGEPAGRRLGRLPVAPDRRRQACAVDPGADGDHGGRSRPPGGAWGQGPHPCRGTRCARCPVGNGGGPQMLFFERRHRRNLGRPDEPRLHRNPAAGSRGGAAAGTLLAGATVWHGQSQWRADALADRQRPVAAACLRPESAGNSRLGRGAVPGAGLCARAMERGA